MFRNILVALAVVVLVFVAVVVTRPPEFRIQRKTAIAAPAATVFAQVNELRKWEAWSPWAKRDPAMKQAYEGPAAGAGAIAAWAGNHEVGEGRMTIVESRPNELIRIKLDFLKPFAATHTAEFTFTPEGNRTNITWSMSGQNNFLAKAIHLFIDMDKMIGNDFEAGLAALKAIAEK